MKKLLSLILAILMVSTMTAAFAEANTEWSGTLRIIGPGALSSASPEASEDLITGQVKPGLDTLWAEWNEDYPNVKIEFTQTPWDNWKAVLQTAAAGGTADILLHGSMLTDISMDLTPYLEATPELYDYMTSGPEMYRDPEDYTKTIPTGLSYMVGPYYALLDKQLFEEWGVELPTADWTWEDLMDLASKMTGANPVTGVENYGIIPFGVGEGNTWKPYSSIGAAWGIESHQWTTANRFEAGLSFNSEDSIKILTFMNDLVKYAPPAYIEGMGGEKVGRADNDIAIVLGEGPMGTYKTTLVDDVADRFLYLPLPANEDQSDSKYSSFTGTSSIAISKNASDPDLAWEFIKWLMMDEDAQQWLFDNNQTAPTKFSAQKLAEGGYPFAECFNEIFNNFWECYSISQTNVIDVGYGSTQAVFFGNVLEMWAGNMTPEECGQAIQDALVEYQEMNK